MELGKEKVEGEEDVIHDTGVVTQTGVGAMWRVDTQSLSSLLSWATESRRALSSLAAADILGANR